MILVIDNYDSFTFNLVHYLQMIGETVRVERNDSITLSDIEKMDVEALILSPGPCTPTEAGISLDVVHRFSGTLPILGVCLGMQTIGQAFGGKIIHAKRIMHGKVSAIEHSSGGVFQGMRSPVNAIRYHSLAIEEATIPDCLTITARAEDGEIMGVRHKEHLTEGVQFHPESILTPGGKRMLQNFMNEVRA
ncbi:MAG: aminodeoxychorismate/anthranilate synthase component II [Spartobacteria bacterium]|nr:aminodeoxychorismate/anthranilate synthase component II [Spartobacteria bacterium]